MLTHKRHGAILMTAMVFLGLAALLMSTGLHSGVDLLPQIPFLKLKLLCESYESDCTIDTLTKYVLFGCLAGFSFGFLLFIGAVALPNKTSAERPPQ